VTTLQLWIVLGAPLLVAALVLLIGGSPVRARIALGCVVAFAVVLALVPGDGGPSITALSLPVVILVASGRMEGPPSVAHHTTRRRYTTVDGT
jgi:hypothetical protein